MKTTQNDSKNEVLKGSQTNNKYGDLDQEQYDVLSIFDKGRVGAHNTESTAKKAENFVESLFFKYEDREVTEEKDLKIVDSKSLSEQNLKFFEGSDRKLYFDDENSLALKSLKEGQVDFADKRVNI